MHTRRGKEGESRHLGYLYAQLTVQQMPYVQYVGRALTGIYSARRQVYEDTYKIKR